MTEILIHLQHYRRIEKHFNRQVTREAKQQVTSYIRRIVFTTGGKAEN